MESVPRCLTPWVHVLVGGSPWLRSRHKEHIGRHSNSHRVTYPICHLLPCPPPLTARPLGDEVAEDPPETLRGLPRVVPPDAEPWRLLLRRWPMEAEVPGRSLVFIREPWADVEGGLRPDDLPRETMPP